MSSPVEQIKQRLNIVDVVGSYIKLQKAGANFKAVCPFHSEKAPSFYISPAREIWHCFGCNKGGDMFEFVRQIEGMEFIEALRVLADRAGVTLTRQDPQLRNERVRLLDLMKEAVNFYKITLAENEKALNYLKMRGLTSESLNNFQIGFAPPEETGWRNLFFYLKGKGYQAKEIEKSGLIIKKSEDDFYDRFRGRIMFPLFDASGRIVGFSGRVFNSEADHLEIRSQDGSSGDSTPAKYINTPQTILYDKSKLLYGFEKAKLEIRKQDSCILVEGQMDVIMSHQSGVTNVVAVSGTALTAAHLDIIGRLTKNLIMAFDSDEAGILAAKRSIDLALEKDFELRVAALPQDKDPADLILEDPEFWKKMISESKHIIEFYLNILKRKYPDRMQFKKQVGKSLLPYLLSIQSGIERSHWITEISKVIHVKEDVVLEELKKIHTNIKREPFHRTCEISASFDGKEERGRRHILEERLAGIAVWKNNKRLIPAAVKNSIYNKIKGAGEKQKNKWALEAELCYVNMENLGEEIDHLVKDLQKEVLKEKLGVLAEEIQNCESSCNEKSLVQKLDEFKTLSRQLAET